MRASIGDPLRRRSVHATDSSIRGLPRRSGMPPIMARAPGSASTRAQTRATRRIRRAAGA